MHCNNKRKEEGENRHVKEKLEFCVYCRYVDLCSPELRVYVQRLGFRFSRNV